MGKEGEGTMLLKQIREMSQDIFNHLMFVDEQLKDLEDAIGSNVSRKELLEKLKTVRKAIGTVEKEDKDEIEEERILEGMVKKLNSLIEMTWK